jgi:uncharacterized protein
LDVHFFQQGDLCLAYDVNSGSLHVLDTEAYTLVQALEDGMPLGRQADVAATQEILAEIADLREAGLLFSPPIEEQRPVYPSEPLIKAICLHVAHDCNLRCRYCFAGTGTFGGGRALMDRVTGKKALDFLLFSSGQRNQCEVDFFGGEPLLNFTLIQELVGYGQEQALRLGKEIKFTLTTNGTLLTPDILSFLEQEEISVVFSLDGRPEVHDRMRPDHSGRGSYQRVQHNLQKLLAAQYPVSPHATGLYCYVRGTYTHFNLDFDRDVEHMAALGIRQVSLEPVVAEPDVAYAFKDGDLQEIFEAYDRLGERVLALRQRDAGFSFFHFNVALTQGPCLAKRLSGCGAGHEYAAISPEGDIYPCHQFVGKEAYQMGSVHNGPPWILDADLLQSFRGAHVYTKAACRECWARFLCSGGCHAANVNFTGHLDQVYDLGCQLQRKRLEVALYIQAQETLRDANA